MSKYIKPTRKKATSIQKSVSDEQSHASVTEPLIEPNIKKADAKLSRKISSKSSSKKGKQSKSSASQKRKTSKSRAKTSEAKVGSKNANQKRRLPFAKKEESKVYTSVKHRNKSMFSGGSGASDRGGVSDLARFQIVWGVALFGLLVLVARAGYVQLINPTFFSEKGEGFITTTKTQTAYRGMISDRNGLPLAVSAPLSTVSFSPYDYANKYYYTKREIVKNADNPEVQDVWRKRLEAMDLTLLANTTGMSLDTLRQAVAIDDNVAVTGEGYEERIKNALPSGTGSHYLLLMREVRPEIADAVTELNFPGVHEDYKFKRYYPQPQPNAQLLGFMGEDSNDPDAGYHGRAGIERMMQERLAGKDGKVLMLKDGSRTELEELSQIEPLVEGQDVTLTIDARLQYLLYKELEKVGRIQRARWATGMVVDVQTGEVLALSTWPAFNNNKLSEMTGENQRNRALIDTFEPGSVMKPFTVAAALKSGEYNINSLINTSPGVIRVRGYNIRDHGNLGTIGFATLLKKSSNVASTKIALKLPADGITSVQREFGFGQKTALNFPAEQAGNVPSPTEKETARRATISYGYGLEVTLAQIAQAYAALGAGGVMHPLTLIKDNANQLSSKSIMPKDDALAIVNMMETVTEEGGTGTAAAIDGYRVAGKTGTSRRVNPEGGYYDDQYRTVFAGIAPASNPRLATVILVEDPQEDHYAGQVAAPVFKKVMQEALRLYNVPLDKPLTARSSTPANTSQDLNDAATEESIP